MKFLKILALCVALLSFELNAKPPELTAETTKVKIQEILDAHSTHKTLTDVVLKRLASAFLEELDPAKCVFLETEVQEWIDPSPKFLIQLRQSIQEAHYAVFKELMQKMKVAFERRGLLEEWLKTIETFPEVSSIDFEKSSFVKTEEELKDKILKIRSLQLKTAKMITTEERCQIQKRLERQFAKKKTDLFGANPQEEAKNTFAFVIKSLASALDNHTAYFTPQEANAFLIQVQQRLFGIGAHLKDDFDGLLIVRLLEGGPAILSKKLKVADKIVAVNHEPIIGMDMVDAVELIRGPQGTNVTLTILRKEENQQENTLNIEITRDEIVLKESRYEVYKEPAGDGIIGRIHLHSFYQDSHNSSYQDVRNAILELKKEKLVGLVLDLRNNGGGLLPQAVEVASLFIGKGIVASIKDSYGNVQHLRNLKDQKVFDGPLIILVNKASASASEIVAQCLQDYGRALIVGDIHTFGKGTYQTFTMNSSDDNPQVNPSGEYKVTRGMYYTVSGKTPQLEGITPELIVPGIFHKAEIGEKYSKNALTPDQIKPNFDDDLSDIHPLYRFKLKRLYISNQQKQKFVLNDYLSFLRENTTQRQASNTAYLEFLKKAESFENFTQDELENPKSDYQLQETFNILKDLIYSFNQGKVVL